MNIKITHTYPAIFYKEEKGYSIIFPDFNGGTQGDDIDEAMTNAQEFLDSIVAYYLDENLELPKPTDLNEYQHDEIFKDYEYITTLIKADPLRFSEKKVRKQLTIPEYLNLRAEKENLNMSKFLTEALEVKYQ